MQSTRPGSASPAEERRVLRWSRVVQLGAGAGSLGWALCPASSPGWQLEPGQLSSEHPCVAIVSILAWPSPASLHGHHQHPCMVVTSVLTRPSPASPHGHRQHPPMGSGICHQHPCVALAGARSGSARTHPWRRAPRSAKCRCQLRNVLSEGDALPKLSPSQMFPT